MADGSVKIDARIDNSNIRSDVERINRELGRMGSNMGSVARTIRDAFNSEINNLGSNVQGNVSDINEIFNNIGSNLIQIGREARINFDEGFNPLDSDVRNEVLQVNNELLRIGINIQSIAAQIRSEYQAEIDRLSSITQSEVNQVNGELNNMGNGMNSTAREIRETFGNNFNQINNDIRRGYSGISAESQRMMNEMKSAYAAQKIGMAGVRDEQIRIQYGFFNLAQQSAEWQGTTEDFISQVEALGAAQKKANDAAINSNRLAMMGMLQTIATMANMTTQAQRISDNYTRMANPIYNVNRAGLAAANSLNQLANRGNAAVLALKMLGPTASMKDLLNMNMMITQGLMRMQMVALMAAGSCALLYGKLHEANMEMNPKYAEAYNNMIEKLTKALQPMRDAFAALMIPIYNFVAAMADLVIKFNEAHPVLAKFIQGVMMLVPALTLILSPLAIGIGLWNGMLAMWNAVWMLIGPLITGLAAMSATVWVVAAAVVGLTMLISHLWKTSETFRNGVMTVINTLKDWGKSLMELGNKGFVAASNGIKQFISLTTELGKYLGHVLLTGENFSDVISNLPKPIQGIATALAPAMVALNSFGQAMVTLGSYFASVLITGNQFADVVAAMPAPLQGIANAIAPLLVSLNSFGNSLVILSKYLVGVVATGNTMSVWINQLPLGFQNAALALGGVVATIRNTITGLVEAIRLAIGGDTSQLGVIFSTIMPSLIAMLVGGLPGLLIAASRFLPTIVQGINQTLPLISTTITNVINTMVNLIVTYLPMFIAQGVAILTKVIEGILQVLPVVVTTLITVATTLINTLVSTIGVLLPIILDAGMKILMAVINGIVTNLPKIIEAALKIMDTLLNALIVLLPKILDAGIKILMAIIDGIVKVLPKLVDTAIMLVNKIIEMIMQNLPKILDAGVKILMAIVDGIIKMLPKIVDAAVKIITQLVNIIMQNLPKIIESGIKILMAIIKGIIQIMPQLAVAALKIIYEIAKTIIANLPQILAAGVQILWSLIKGIYSVLSSLWSAITDNVIGGIKKCFSNAGSMLLSAGKDIVRGLADGISGMASDAINAAKKMAGKVKDAVTGFFDIHSPSRVMKAVGGFITEGVAVGIKDQTSEVVKAAELMSSAVLDGFEALSNDIELGNIVGNDNFQGMDLGVTPDFKLPKMDDVIKGSVSMAPTAYERMSGSVKAEKETRKAEAQNGSDEKQPTYIIMDKKVVGEVISEDVDNANKRRTNRLAQFAPQVVPAF
ncbi:carbamoyl-phosphate synthase [Bacillus cereus group sp. BfR-BA-01315]|uniref:carbamoyl-phosphate synthase n=1 Tax=Bacillus cereus group sp. BfR-BA-01315 TaxID=2920292 RepID=UPI001F568F18|nr:carbamoyl-phosphate synthase [Bacillus cereus group sp. BfR-BA-01315]